MLKSLFTRVARERRQRSITQALSEAVRAREAGRLAEAERCAREALEVDPAHLDSRLMLADVLLRSGRGEEAVSVARQAVAAAPASADALEVLAAALRGSGNQREVEAALVAAVKLEPDRLSARNELAALLIERRRYPDAIALLRWVLKRKPEFAAAQGNLGIALHLNGRSSEAAKPLEEALRLAPDDPVILGNNALYLRDLDRLEEAEALLRRASAVPGAGAAPLINLANVLRELGRPGDGLELLESFVAAEPRNAEARSTLAKILQDLRELERAAREFDAAVALQPESAYARLARAMYLLAKGDFERGWAEYEARLDTHESPRRAFAFPEWDGSSSFGGKSVLVCAEQGLGDEIMFASCFPDLLAEARRCVIECDPRLERLFGRSFPEAAVFGGRGAADHPWLERAGPIDVRVAAGSLPLRFRRHLARFPAHTGYLRAESERVAEYRARLAQLGRGLKVGITWRGGLGKTRRSVRSVPVEEWLPILARDDAQFVSLQHGPVEADLSAFAQLPGARSIAHWAEVHADCAELAALMSALDVIITVCNAAVHLGGALGKPVLVLVPFSPEWRYLLHGDRMPWYPSVRLFRQAQAGEWAPVVAQVAGALAGLRGA